MHVIARISRGPSGLALLFAALCGCCTACWGLVRALASTLVGCPGALQGKAAGGRSWTILAVTPAGSQGFIGILGQALGGAPAQAGQARGLGGEVPFDSHDPCDYVGDLQGWHCFSS